jgi:RND family efflux transporter MFP subunit
MADRQDTPIPVTTATSEVRDSADVFEVSGVVRGRTSATLASRVMAPVRAVLAQPGDRVRAGQALLLLDDRDLSAVARQAGAQGLAAARALDVARADQAAARAAQALARATHARIATLNARKSATAQEFDQTRAAADAADARLAQAQAAVEQAEAGLDAARAGRQAADVTASFARITAPFDGVVTEKLVDPGNLATPGTPLLRMEDTRAYEVEVRVDESRAAWVARDLRVRVTVDGPNGPLDLAGRVIEIARAIDAGTRTVLVTIAVPPTDALRPGMFGRVPLPGPTRRTLTIPDAAVVRRGQLTSVFVIDQGKARLRLVDVGRTSADRTEVLAGLSAGEAVVIAPPPTLRDGAALSDRAAPAADAPARSGGQS